MKRVLTSMALAMACACNAASVRDGLLVRDATAMRLHVTDDVLWMRDDGRFVTVLEEVSWRLWMA